jgi:hypothetical protein
LEAEFLRITMSQAEPDLLFVTEDLSAVMAHQSAKARLSVDSYDADRLLNTPTADLVRYFVEHHQLDVPSLHREQALAEQREGPVFVVDHFSKDYGGGRGHREIMGTHVELTIPFSGDARMFQVRPTTFDTGPPRAALSNGCLIIRVVGREMTTEGVQKELDGMLDRVELSMITIGDAGFRVSRQFG